MAKRSRADILREKGDIAGLVHMVRHATDWLDGMEAAEALAILGNKSGVDYLLECLQDPDDEVRAVAVEMLQGLDDPRGKQALEEISLESPHEIIQDDPDASLECGNCGSAIPTDSKVCPQCGIKLYGDKIRSVPKEASKALKSSLVIQPFNYKSNGLADDLPGEVVVVDFDIPFLSLVWLLVKIALASIPAMLILGLLSVLVFLFFGGALIGLISQIR